MDPDTDKESSGNESEFDEETGSSSGESDSGEESGTEDELEAARKNVDNKENDVKKKQINNNAIKCYNLQTHIISYIQII